MRTATLPSSSTSAVSRAAAAPARPASALARWASLLYGSVTYLGFLGTFLTVMAFVYALPIPVTIDGGRPAALGEALLVNGGFLALFAIQHTIMARRSFKRVWTRIVPAHVERTTFVLVTCLILCGMLWQWRALPGVVWRVEGLLAWVLLAVSAIGWGTVLYATFLIDHFELFGLRQVVRYFRGLPPAPPVFVERSLYRRIRHPLMTGFLLAFWATPVMSGGHLFFAVMCTAYILVGIQIEERSLIAEHGESSLSYKRRVPSLFPTRRPIPPQSGS